MYKILSSLSACHGFFHPDSASCKPSLSQQTTPASSVPSAILPSCFFANLPLSLQHVEEVAGKTTKREEEEEERPSRASGVQLAGVVKNWSIGGGYGFIDGGRQDYFCHASEWLSGTKRPRFMKCQGLRC